VQAVAKYLPRGDGLAHRFHTDLPPDRVTAFNLRSGRFGGAGPDLLEEHYADGVRLGRWFAERMNRRLARTSIDPKTTAAFLFSTGALETCTYLNRLGVPVIVDQLDPARVDERVLQEEMERWLGWEALPGKIPELYYSRLSHEWRLADLILANSGWSRSALLEQRVEVWKIIVVTLCYEPASAPPDKPPLRGSAMRSFTVLWLGQVVLRKGIPYLFEAAVKLLNSNVRFVVAGRVGISEKGLRNAPANVQILGICHAAGSKAAFLRGGRLPDFRPAIDVTRAVWAGWCSLPEVAVAASRPATRETGRLDTMTPLPPRVVRRGVSCTPTPDQAYERSRKHLVGERHLPRRGYGEIYSL
jgi:glycosyltransferase involved in cell wall biosynthesis